MRDSCMVKIIVTLEVKDRASFSMFEKQAIEIMGKYEGKLILAFEPNKEESTLLNIDEVHHLEFPNIKLFRSYRTSPELKALTGLRNKGISKTTVIVSGSQVAY